eukprot:142235_1
MWPKLSSMIRSIINDSKNKIEIDDLATKTIANVIDILKIKNIAIGACEYLKKLIQRAKEFKPITNATSNKYDMNEMDDVKDHTMNGLHINKHGLNKQSLFDIYSVHKVFIFSK